MKNLAKFGDGIGRFGRKGIYLAAFLAASVLGSLFLYQQSAIMQSDHEDLSDKMAAGRQPEMPGATFIVTSTIDSGAGSLRQAILDANAAAGADTISFNITGTGLKTIAPLSPLPVVTDTVTINGYSQGTGTPTLTDDAKTNTAQFGSNAVLLIELDGANAGSANGLNFAVGSNASTARGLVIRRFSLAGVAVASNTTSVLGNFIGTNASGSAAEVNGVGVLVTGNSNKIGQSGPANRNVISGNTGDGILIQSGTDNAVANNHIGLNAANTAVLGNGASGVHVGAAAPANKIGLAVGSSGNTISGNGDVNNSNSGDGVLIESAGNSVLGNTIGPDASRAVDRGNLRHGVHIPVTVAGNIIGGSSGSVNYIAGNGGDGVHIEGNSASTPTGTQTTVGRNEIGVLGAVTPMGNDGDGIEILNSSRNVVVGAADLTPLRIAANAGNGIKIWSGGVGLAPSTFNTINRTDIGVTFGNGGNGILIENSSQNTVGGVLPAERNQISGNMGDGIHVASGNRNRFEGNTFSGHGGLGIDLAPDGVNINDPLDSDAGANDGQNVPIVSSVVGNEIFYTLNSTPNTAFRVTAYRSGSADPSGSGEGAIFTTFFDGFPPTDAMGNMNFSIIPTNPNGQFITITVTDPNGNTSEFSQAIRLGQAPTVTTISSSMNPVPFGQNVTFTSTVGASSIPETPTGTVSFKDGAATIGTGTLDANGVATFTTSSLATGTHNITAVYNGGPLFQSSTSPVLVLAVQGSDSCTTAVLNVNDSGAGSLREAINCANVIPGRQTISFTIPGAGPHVISPTTPLPIVLDAADIDGYTQSGSSANTAATGTNAVLKIVLTDVNYVSTFIDQADLFGVLRLQGGGAAPGSGTVIRGLVIQISRAGSAIHMAGTGGHVVEGCFIGTNVAGFAASSPASTGFGIFGVSDDNRIGGSAAAARNLISANRDGVGLGNRLGLVYSSADRTMIQNNLIGVNAAGTAALPNTAFGIVVDNADGTRIRNNVVSGNAQTGVELFAECVGGPGCLNHLINDTEMTGNFIGTNEAGNTAIPNSVGVRLFPLINIYDENTPLPMVNNTRIGMPGNGNVISGNTGSGVLALENALGSLNNLDIRANKIGTNTAGTTAIPNNTAGAAFDGGLFLIATGDMEIGGLNAGEANVISGNIGFGVGVFGSLDARVHGNFIGTNGAGTSILPNTGDGILADGIMTIGGSGAAERNIISGNGGHGLNLGTSAANLQNNYIGVGSNGNTAMGNGGSGIHFENGSPGSIGGTNVGNVIANNGGDGITLVTVAERSQRIFVSENSIYGNAGLGIDLSDDGVTANDPNDTDTGANAPQELQNFPVLASVGTNGGSTTVVGALNSMANTTFRIEFFSIPACDASGNGEGQTFIGAASVTTVGNVAPINAVLPVAATTGQFVTSTASDPNGNTSEFSACVLVTGSGTPTPTSTPTASPTATPTATPTPGAGFESDVAPRPNGDGIVLSTDVTQMRRFATGLDTPGVGTNEVQRADSAPRITRGDGIINSGDVIQARRYATGLDPLTEAGGPAGPSEIANIIDEGYSYFFGRELRVGEAMAVNGETVTVPVEMIAFGDEVAESFTLEFDAKRLANPRVVLAEGSPDGAVLTVNTYGQGHIGILIDSIEPITASAMPKRIVMVTFDVLPYATGDVPIFLTSSLAQKGISDPGGNTLWARYVDGVVRINSKD